MATRENDRSEIYRGNLDINRQNDARIFAFSYIQPKSVVLDVGCACGDFGIFLKREKDCAVYGMEYDENSIKIAKHTNAYSDIHQVDLNHLIESDFEKYYEMFDYIVLLDVLEHLIQPPRVLENFKRFLKKDGFLILSIPNVAHCSIKANLLLNDFTYTETGILDKTHIRFFTYKSIVNLLSSLSFEIKENNVVVSDVMFSEPSQSYNYKQKLPITTKRFILKDIHSYIYQYVMMIGISKINLINLHEHNDHKMQIRWCSISKIIKKMRYDRTVNSIFPRGSLQYRIAKKIYRFVKNSMLFNREP